MLQQIDNFVVILGRGLDKQRIIHHVGDDMGNALAGRAQHGSHAQEVAHSAETAHSSKAAHAAVSAHTAETTHGTHGASPAHRACTPSNPATAHTGSTLRAQVKALVGEAAGTAEATHAAYAANTTHAAKSAGTAEATHAAEAASTSHTVHPAEATHATKTAKAHGHSRIQLGDGGRQHEGIAVLHAVDVVVQGTGRDSHFHVNLFNPIAHFIEYTRIGRHGDEDIYAIDRKEANGGRLFAESDALKDGFKFLGHIRRLAVANFKLAHALAGQHVAVEQRDQFHGAPHAAGVVQHNQQIGRLVANDLATLPKEGRNEAFNLFGRGKLQEQQIQDLALARGQILGAGVQRGADGQLHGVRGRDDAVKISHLHHGGAIDAQNGFQYGPHLQCTNLAIGTDDHLTIYPGVEDVIDLQTLGQQIDQLAQ